MILLICPLTKTFFILNTVLSFSCVVYYDWFLLSGSENKSSLVKISEIFNVTTDWLLTGEDEMHPTATPSPQPELTETEEILTKALDTSCN